MLFVSVLSRFSSKRARLCSRRRFCREGIHKEKRKRRRLPASPASPLRKRSRLLRRFGCKRPHDASAALPIACGARQEDSPCGESVIRAQLCARRCFCREGGTIKQHGNAAACPPRPLLLSASDPACCGDSVVNALMTPPLRCQSLAGNGKQHVNAKKERRCSRRPFGSFRFIRS